MSTFTAFFTMGTVTAFLILVGCAIGAGLVKLHHMIFGERKDGL